MTKQTVCNQKGVIHMKTLYTQTGRATARKNQENLLKITLDKNLSSKEHLKRLALRLNLTEVKDL